MAPFVRNSNKTVRSRRREAAAVKYVLENARPAISRRSGHHDRFGYEGSILITVATRKAILDAAVRRATLTLALARPTSSRRPADRPSAPNAKVYS